MSEKVITAVSARVPNERGGKSRTGSNVDKQSVLFEAPTDLKEVSLFQ